MKLKIVILLLIISSQFCSAQFFENDLDYLVYDKQDSLMKSLRVETRVSESYMAFKDKIPTARETLRYNDSGLIEYSLKEDYDYSYQKVYSYDSLKLKKIRSNKFRGAKNIKSYESSYLLSFTKGMSRIESDYSNYEYDSIGKLKYIIKCEKKECELENYLYSGDTTIVLFLDSKKEKLGIKKTFESKYSKTLIVSDFLDEHNLLIKYDLSTDGLRLTKKYWSDGEMYLSQSFFLNKDHNTIKKNISISKVSVYGKNNKLVEKNNVRCFYHYNYDEKNRLIESIKFEKGKKQLTKYIYYDNDLLKQIITPFYYNKKAVNFSYKFHKN